MRFLTRRDDHPAAAAWWVAVSEYPGGAPGIVGELLRGSRSVVCDRVEAEQAMAWARAHPAWADDPAPLVIIRPRDDRSAGQRNM
jgi:hypothetical protein